MAKYNRGDRAKKKRRSIDGAKMCAWTSLVVGLAEVAPLLLGVLLTLVERCLNRQIQVRLPGPDPGFICCCSWLVLPPIAGMWLGIGGLKAQGYAYWLAWTGIGLSIGGPITMCYIIIHNFRIG
jgi:hypothetical protein